MSYGKPLPRITPLDKGYWEHNRSHRLHLQKCGACAAFRFPASPVCSECGGADWSYQPVSGRGKILSWVVFHRLYFPGFADDIPYNVAGVVLDEGVMMMSNILAPNENLYQGMDVEVIFEDVTPEISIPKFRPMEKSERD